ncbi:hypothetical protein [Aestuariispira ectoiniformans]|uniref:hypothetical protein n=1 Tax=Aestuariispira ectoiniformans TaxID=2775080 RepID=UPI00223BF482|nr:hypothetical protein [Aestuariispira ectoiniformans]
MKTFNIAAVAAIVLSAASAYAADVSFEVVDANADSLVSFEELSAVNTDVTEEAFIAADADKDGQLNAEEFKALMS